MMYRLTILLPILLLCACSFTASAQKNKATFYAKKFYGRQTSTGETLDPALFTAASQQYDWGTVLQVTNKNNGRTTQVKVNDCGPHHPEAVLDLSQAAAQALQMTKAGRVPVGIKVVRASTAGPTCSRGAWAKKLRARGVAIPPPPPDWVPTETQGALPPAAIVDTDSDVTTLPVVQPATSRPLSNGTGTVGFYPISAQLQKTSRGETYLHSGYTAASASHPYNTILSLTNIDTGKKVSVRVNDCGPLQTGHALTVSRMAASKLGLLVAGPAPAEIQVIKLGTDGPVCEDEPILSLPPADSSAPQTYISTPGAPVPAAETPEEKFDPDAILFGIKIGAYSKRAGAEKAAAMLGEKGLEKPYTLSDGKMIRVYTGKFYFQTEAEAYRDEVRAAGYPTAVVRRVQ